MFCRSELIEVGLYPDGVATVNTRQVRVPYEAPGVEDVTIKTLGLYLVFEGFNGKRHTKGA